MAQLENEVKIAREAKELKSRLLNKFFADKDQMLWKAFQDSAIGDVDALVQIHTQYKSINALQHELMVIENTGKLAQKGLEESRNK